MYDPYEGINQEDYIIITQKIISSHPLYRELAQIVLDSWTDILKTKIGGKLQICEDIFPSPQIMGNYLHELVPVNIESMEEYAGKWSKDSEVSEKDVVCLYENKYSFEIKTSSNKDKIFGNRSYGQKQLNPKKSKDGYYLAINFEKPSRENKNPKIVMIRLGWVNHYNWKAQKAATGQAATLGKEVYEKQFLTLYKDGVILT